MVQGAGDAQETGAVRGQPSIALDAVLDQQRLEALGIGAPHSWLQRRLADPVNMKSATGGHGG